MKAPEIPFHGTARPSGGGNGGFVELDVETAADSTALTYDFGELASAFVGVEISLPAVGAVDLVHADRIGDDGTIDPHGCASRCVVRLYCPQGRTRLESFEPYCVRYLQGDRAAGERVHAARRVPAPVPVPGSQGRDVLCSDGKLNRIYEAARLTLRANTVDVFLDTRGRERGGWLCDSFWTARAAHQMLGDPGSSWRCWRTFSRPRLPSTSTATRRPCIPRPPGRGSHHPNWTMFLVLHLHELYRRTGDRSFIDRYEVRVAELAAQLALHEDAEGVLNRLPGRIFVDGSTAPLPEYFSRPISMPTNALYARMLECIDELYGRPALRAKARRIRTRLRVAPAAHALASLKRCKPARAPIYRDGDRYALDPHDAEADLWVFRLGLQRSKPATLPVDRPAPAPLPTVDALLTVAYLDDAWRDGVPRSWSAQRVVLCVLDANGRAMDPEEALVLVDVAERALDTFVGDEIGGAVERLAAYDIIAAIDVRTLLRTLRFEPGDRRLGELGPPQKTRTINRSGRALKITTSLLVQGSCGISLPFGDARKMRAYLTGGQPTKLRRRLEADAKSLYALYQYGRLHGTVRLRWGFLDERLPAPWVHRDEVTLYKLMNQACQRGVPLEIVVGTAPGWADPWSRAQLAHVEKDGWRSWLVDDDGYVIHRDEIQLARLSGAG